MVDNRLLPMREVQEISVGIFDINGTIQDKEGVPEQVSDAFRAMGHSGLRTTIATGRGINRAKELLGDTLPLVVSPGMPLSVENGGRLTTRDGANITYHTLSGDVQTNALDILQAEQGEVEFAAYYPRDNKRGIVLWSPNGDVPDSFIQRHGMFGELHSDSILDLAKRIKDDEACMLIIKPRDIAMATAFRDANVEINEGELNVLNHGVNKGQGVLDIAEFTGMPLDALMVAGNDHNDVSMLSLPVGRKFFVGDNEINLHDEKIIRVSTPVLLGDFLKNTYHPSV